MPPLLLICDPTYDYPRSFGEHLNRREIVMRHVRTGKECLRAVQIHQPDFVLISSETDGGRLHDVVRGLHNMTNRTPQVFYASFKPAWRFSEEQGLAAGQCIQRPFDEAAFADGLASLWNEDRTESETLHTRSLPL
jgi:DNA-binding NtrC family response regulator